MDSDVKWKLSFVRHLMYMRNVNWIFILAGLILLTVFGGIFAFNFIVAESYIFAKDKVHTEATLISVTEDFETYTERDSDRKEKQYSDAYYELTYEYELEGEKKEVHGAFVV